MTLPRLGLCLPQFLSDPAVTLAAAAEAEALGYASVSLFDHLRPLGGPPSRPALECTTMLAAVAARTARVRVLPLVLRAGLRAPALAGHVVASLDRLAPGRTVLGLGAGDAMSAAEDRSIGLPDKTQDERRADVVATVRAVRELAPGVPVWLGGTSPAMQRLAGEIADGWNVWAATPEEVARGAVSVLDAAGGQPREVTWGGQVLVAATQREADDRFAAWAAARRPEDVARVVRGDAAAVDRQLRRLGAEGVAECLLAVVGDDAAAQRRILATLL